jgi:hypothetical protein
VILRKPWKLICNYNIYILNLVGRSVGKCFRKRIISGCSCRFKISSLAVLVAIAADFVLNRSYLERNSKHFACPCYQAGRQACVPVQVAHSGLFRVSCIPPGTCATY